MKNQTKIAICQTNPKIGNLAFNLQTMKRFVHQAADSHVACFPELNLCGYMFETKEEVKASAISTENPIHAEIQALASEKKMYIIYSFLEVDGSQLFNTSILAGPDKKHRLYRKVHLPFIGADRFLTPGDQGFPVFETPYGTIAINICYDQSFPESARICSLKKADIIFIPGNWNSDSREVLTLLPPARALENHVHYVVVNRTGKERGASFIGSSAAYDVHGKQIHKLSAQKEEIGIFSLNSSESQQKRVIKVPNKHEIDRINDRRPNIYKSLVVIS